MKDSNVMKKSFLIFSALLMLSACGKKSQAESADTAVADSTDVKAKEEMADLNEPQEEVPELTFANMAGIYDSFNEDGGNESRIGLNEDGTATWNMIGSLHYTEYTYTINGNSICLKPIDVDSEEDCYDYNPDTRTLRNEQGAVYYRQVVE